VENRQVKQRLKTTAVLVKWYIGALCLPYRSEYCLCLCKYSTALMNTRWRFSGCGTYMQGDKFLKVAWKSIDFSCHF